jgi:hypothetical protein
MSFIQIIEDDREHWNTGSYVQTLPISDVQCGQRTAFSGILEKQ